MSDMYTLREKEFIESWNQEYLIQKVENLKKERHKILLKKEYKFGIKDFEKIIFPKAKWVRIDYTWQRKTGLLPQSLEIPGIYVFYNPYIKRILYIGQSKNIKKRLSQYIKIDLGEFRYIAKINGETIHCFKLAIRQDKKNFERLMIERRLINKFKPKYNIQGKSNE